MLNLFHHLILFDSIFPTEIFRSFYELTVSAKKTIVVQDSYIEKLIFIKPKNSKKMRAVSLFDTLGVI